MLNFGVALMMTNNFVLYGGKILGETLRDIVFFPLWWYSRGFLQTSLSLLRFLNNRQKSLALLVWVKNIFTPMYGQTDWQGRLISVFIRIVQIIFRSLMMLFWCFFALTIILLWLIVPLFTTYQIVYQLSLFN